MAAGIAAVTDFRVKPHRRGSDEPDLAFFHPVMKEEHIEIEGCVKVVLPGTMFRVELDNKHLVLATICGKMRKRFVRLTVGDRVKMEMSPYDLDKARITWRLR
jgi:translation initiation factor IF-1